MITIGSLFSGIGGFELGLERAIPNSKTIWQCEQDKFCQQILKKHWPDAVIYDDVRQINKNNTQTPDILCGGFPCQGFSVAGKGDGFNHAKSNFYWEMHRVISDMRPRVVVFENVPAINKRGLSDVLLSLAKIGYDAEWTVISAAQFGAPHLRKRWFCVAYPSEPVRRDGGYRLEKTRPKQGTQSKFLHQTRTCSAKEFACFSTTRAFANPHMQRCKKQFLSISIKEKQHVQSNISGQGGQGNYWQNFPTQSPLCDRDDGIPNRMARLRALGNAIVPQCSQWIGEQILKSGLLEEK